jgi:hypothetical protein
MIPPGSTITNATLYLYEKDKKLGQVTYIYKVTSDWNEDSVTWNTPWLTPGGDFDNTYTYASFLPNQTDCILAIDLTELVQEWVNGVSNYGFILYSTGPNHILRYSSKENTSVDQHPKLSITYNQSASLSSSPALNAVFPHQTENQQNANFFPSFLPTLPINSNKFNLMSLFLLLIFFTYLNHLTKFDPWDSQYLS